MNVTSILQEFVRGSHMGTQKVKSNMFLKILCMPKGKVMLQMYEIHKYAHGYDTTTNTKCAQVHKQMHANGNFIYDCVQMGNVIYKCAQWKHNI